MKKFIGIYLFIALCITQLAAYTAENIDKAIKDSNINRGAVSISVKDINSGKQLYSLHANSPINPASTQKLVTFAAAYDILGEDYNFTTSLYKSTNNELYLKLSGDPFLTTKDLKSLLSTAKSKNITEPKGVYIDDYVLDSEYWGEGWQWDDELNPLMPKFGSYNLDKNLIKIVIRPTVLNSPADIFTDVFYPIGFVNLVTTGRGNQISLSHNVSISQNLIQAEGTVESYTTKTIPINNIKRYFRLRLEDALNDSKVFYYGKIYQKKLPANNVYLVDSIDRPISEAAKSILSQSSNMAAETVFKLAGGKYVNNTGSIKSALAMFNDFCERNNINTKDIIIVDGSGVSKNNLVTADFMTDFLVAEAKQPNFASYKEAMAIPGSGTLANRMLYFKDKLWAKTGTLTNISAIAGYMKTQKGSDIAFDVMINDPKSQSTDKKILEELILRAIYVNY